MECEPIENYNDTLGAGKNPNTTGIAIQRGIYVMDDPEKPGEPIMSHMLWHKWKMTPEELEVIKETGEIYVGFVGVTHPPMNVEVVHPERFANFTAFTKEEVENIKREAMEGNQNPPETKD